MSSMCGHERPREGATNDWLTPPDIVRRLGPFDLDPCASVAQPWATAATMWTVHDDGFSRDWAGSVWLNPPYGPHVGKWLGKLADHGDGVALVFARTETEMFHSTVWDRASACYFLRGRLRFHRPVSGERAAWDAGAPSVLVAYGDAAARFDRPEFRVAYPGRLVSLDLR